MYPHAHKRSLILPHSFSLTLLQRAGSDPDLDEFMNGLVAAVSRYHHNVQEFYQQQEAALKGFDARLAALAEGDAGMLQSARDEQVVAAAAVAAGGAAKRTATVAAAATPDLAILKDTPQFREELKRNYRKELLEWKARVSCAPCPSHRRAARTCLANASIRSDAQGARACTRKLTSGARARSLPVRRQAPQGQAARGERRRAQDLLGRQPEESLPF